MSSVNIDGPGEMMAIFFKDGHPVILVGPSNDPDSAEILYIGPRFYRERSAMRHAKPVYFRFYLERYGFRHPQDPILHRLIDRLQQSSS